MPRPPPKKTVAPPLPSESSDEEDYEIVDATPDHEEKDYEIVDATPDHDHEEEPIAEPVLVPVTDSTVGDDPIDLLRRLKDSLDLDDRLVQDAIATLEDALMSPDERLFWDLLKSHPRYRDLRLKRATFSTILRYIL